MGIPLCVVGVDCACRARGVGLAVATMNESRVSLESVTVGQGDRSMAAAIGGHLRELLDGHPQVVLALDAPLGWPAPLARALAEHRAGDRLGDLGDADEYVYRRTDAVVYEHVQKWPLDVGANYIARTAFAALELLAVLRQGGRSLPLLWRPGVLDGAGAIEVYPAATFLARRLKTKGYKSEKRTENEPPRRALVQALAAELEIPQQRHELMVTSDHALDAVACVLAAKDFIDAAVVEPSHDERPLAEREGWIWFRRPLR